MCCSQLPATVTAVVVVWTRSWSGRCQQQQQRQDQHEGGRREDIMLVLASVLWLFLLLLVVLRCGRDLPSSSAPSNPNPEPYPSACSPQSPSGTSHVLGARPAALAAAWQPSWRKLPDSSGNAAALGTNCGSLPEARICVFRYMYMYSMYVCVYCIHT